MGLNRRNLFQGLALLVTLITFSCSKPGDDLVSDDSSKPATAEVSNKSDVAAVSAEPKKPATEETKKKRVQQTSRALIPRPQVSAPIGRRSRVAAGNASASGNECPSHSFDRASSSPGRPDTGSDPSHRSQPQNK